MRRLTTFATILLACGLVLAQTETQRQEQQSQPGPETRQGQLATMRTQHYSGTLVDANCMAGASSISSSPTTSSSTEASQSSADRMKKPESSAERSDAASERHAKTETGEHPRAGKSRTSQETQKCPVSTATTAFGLQLSDGRFAKFDEVGNARAAEMLKTKKKWQDQVNSSKPIRARVNGTLEGDKLTVVTVD